MKQLSDEIKTLTRIIKHQRHVSFMLRELARKLEQRADMHDQSKLEFDELEGFYQLDIGRSHQKQEYGSKDYEAGIKIDAVKLHFSRNSHHPEHWPNGIEDMPFIDILEMLFDWEAARLERDTQTDMDKTWEMRQKRFNLTNEQTQFLRTVWEKLAPTEKTVTTVWKDGTYKSWGVTDAHYAAQDPDWLVNI